MPRAIHGKEMIAHAMFHKGKHFVGAAILLRRNNGYKDVVLHLLCQGLECIQKGLLLARDFDRYKPQLIKPIGHNLILGADAVQAAFKLKPLTKPLRAELQKLNDYFRFHLLRYGGIGDVFGGGGQDLNSALVERRTVALIRLGNKAFKR